MRLNGSAGTGKKILKNWNLFNYKVTNIDEKEGTLKVFFDFSFDETVSNGVIVQKTNQDGITYIDQDTLLISKSFQTTLGAYKDTADFNDGLYEVGRRIIDSLESDEA